MNNSVALMCLSLGLLTASHTGDAKAQNDAEPMQFVECDFEKAVEVYGFKQSPAKVVDGLNSALDIDVYEVSDHVVRFAYQNPFKAIDLYSKWHPDTTGEPAVTGLTVEINRLTGGGQLVFSRPPTASEKSTCEQGRNWGCNDPRVMGSVAGTCRAVVRRF